LHLSEHFIHRWQHRVGSLPTPELVKALIRAAVVLQRGVIGVDECGDRFVALSMYWVPEIDAVLKINDMGWPHRAITVITPDVLNKKRVPKMGTDTNNHTARHRGGNIGPCPSIPGHQNGKSSRL
jgi:hypothetical protein